MNLFLAENIAIFIQKRLDLKFEELNWCKVFGTDEDFTCLHSYFQPRYTVTHHFVAVHHSAAMIPQNLSQDFFFNQSQKSYDHVNEPQLHMQHQYPNSSQQNCPNLIEVQKRRSRRSKRRFRRSRQRSSEFNAQQSEKASPNSCHEIMDIKKICSNESSDISTIATMESSSFKTNM